MDFLPYLQSSRKDYLRISIRPLLLQHSVRLSDGSVSKKYCRDMIGEPIEITTYSLCSVKTYAHVSSTFYVT